MGLASKRTRRGGIAWLTKSAEQGFADAQFELGVHYVEGTAVATDEKKGFDLFKKAASAGNIKALVNLGLCYERGYGVEENLGKAFEIFLKAAELGNMIGQYNAGTYYDHGIGGVNVDLEKAISLCRKAAEQGLTLAILRLEELGALDKDYSLSEVPLLQK